MFILLDAFWFVWIIKFILFWLYLWQLKEYHTGRFLDHFRTFKGKKLLYSPEQILKIILLALLFLAPGLFNFIFTAITFLYVVETILFLRVILNKAAKKPVLTIKTIFLTIVSFAIAVLFIIWTFGLQDFFQPSALLIFDILTPLIISAIVLLFQPIFVAARNAELKKAKDKMEKVKAESSLKVIAITGSYGKTSTKEFLTAMLSAKFSVLSTKEHQNSEIGVANCILQDLKLSHQIFIAEVGAYNKGKIKEVCNVIKPQIGIVTGVNEQHLALFGTLENLLSAEGGEELSEALPSNGMLVVNGDNKYCLNLAKKTHKNVKIYSLSNKTVNAEIWPTDIEVFKDFISFMAMNRAGEVSHIEVDVLGKQNVQNLLAAILVAKELGMTFGEISDACKNISQKMAGMVLKNGKLGLDIVDSSYSSNPDGVFADLDYFSTFDKKKVIVMPCLIELGKKSAEIHEKIGKKIGDTCDLAIITSRDKFKEVEKGFKQTKKQGAKIVLCDNVENIYSEITLFCKVGDAVLLEGRVPGELINLLIK